VIREGVLEMVKLEPRATTESASRGADAPAEVPPNDD
jgi:hypothetical protein